MERARQSLPIQGINRAESDDTVADGACEDIYNLRYRAGSFETVCAPQLIRPVNDWSGFSAVIRLDDMPEDEYAARRGDELWRVRLAEGSALPQEKIMDFPKGAADARYFGFGRMLYVNYALEGELQEQCFRYRDNAFERVDFAAVMPPAIQVSCDDQKSAAKEKIGEFDIKSVKIAYVERYDDNPASNKEEFFYNVGIGALNEEGYISGTAYVFAAYKLFDGSIIKPSGLRTITADGIENDSEYLYKAPYGSTKKHFYYGRVRGMKPTLTITVSDAVINNSLIERVVIYSTRNIPSYNFEKIHLDFGKTGYPVEDVIPGAGEIYKCSHGCIWNEDLDEITGPFYEVAEIDFRAGESSVTLTYEKHFKDIEHFPVYAPNYSCHNTISKGKYDYNDRLHIFGLKTELFRDAKAFILPEGVTGGNGLYECFAEYTLQTGGDTYVVRSNEPGHAWIKTGATVLTHYLYNLLSYPDSRANKVDIWVRKKSSLDGVFRTEKHVQYKLRSSPSINFSYAQIERAGNYVPVQSLFTNYSGKELTTVLNEVIESENKIQVSRSSNPFVYDPAHIYTVGGSGERIRQIISTAERMTEAVYGYQPLLVFTDRTVYALESGEGETLYARTIPILSRTIVEGTNAVEGEGAVFFVSTSGITAIVRGQISSVSDAMKRYAGLRPADEVLADFDDYARSARLMFNRKESELIVYNPATDYAYIYSLSGQYWTRRVWDGAVEPYFNELATGAGVVSLSEEDPARPVAECRLITRPLKLGSLEYKRLETLVARMRWGAGRSFRLEVEGSDDAIRWFSLRSEWNRSMIRRTPSSFRYHRFRLVGSGADYLAITHFDVEFYNRFIHRLR